MGKGSEEMSSYLTLYIEVGSVEQRLTKAEAAGSDTVLPRTVIPDIDTFGMMRDPAGNIVGMERQVESAG